METKEIFDGRYVVYSDGRVWSNIRNKFKIPIIGRDGYIQHTFYVNGKTITKQIHRIIAKCFIPNPDNLPQINHIDHNRINNNIENLEWCTRRYNQIHTYKTNYPGCCYEKDRNKWRSMIRVNKKLIHLGRFNTPQEASQKYFEYCTLHNLL